MKKSLSILIALLMILSSMPIMAFTASAEQADPNVMADYTYENWQIRKWGGVDEGTESLNGGNSIYLSDVNFQKAFTTVTLKPNTTYLLDFNWKANAGENGEGIIPHSIYVFAESTYGSNEALLAPAASAEPKGGYNGSGLWHHSNGYFYPAGATGELTNLSADLETATDDATPRKNATAGTWQHVATKFTTNSTDTEYAIMFSFHNNSTEKGGPNQIHFSDFRLVNPSALSLATPIEQKDAEQWFPWKYSRIYEDTSKVQDDGTTTSLFRVEMPAYQTIATTVTLDPNTKYIFTFDYYSETHSNGSAPTIENIYIYPFASGDVFASSSWDGNGYINAAQCQDLEQGGSYGSGADNWVAAQTSFTTTEETRYNILIKFNVTKAPHAEDQKIYLADFSLDTFVAEKPGNILNNANYANGDVSWSTEEGHRLEPKMNFEEGLDNPAFSLNGGYAWGFNFGYDEITGENFGYVYIKAKDLKADTTYDFSYICVNAYRFKIDSIKNDTEAVTEYIVEPAYATIEGQPAEKTTVMFAVPEDGDYVITLKSNKDSEYHMPTHTLSSTTYLCDLELYERGAMYTVAVDTEGNGAAKADKAGMLEEGTVVTFTAKAELYESFLGWYVGDELVSNDLVYTATVTVDLNPVAKFTSNSENLMANHTYADFTSADFSTLSEGESRYGGNAVLAYNVMHQDFKTTVNLKANKEYTFSFEWKSVANQYNEVYPAKIDVKYNGTGTDIENGGGYANQEKASSCTWQNITTTFTPTVAGEYTINIPLTMDEEDSGDGQGVVHHNNAQSIYFSDFVLKEEYVDESDPLGYKLSSDWACWKYSQISGHDESRYGGNAYYVDKSMFQSIATDVTLKPNTAYNLSFEWKAVDNERGNAYPAIVGVYSAKSGTIPPANNASPYPENGYVNLAQNVTYPTIAPDKATEGLTDWNTITCNLTTTEDTEYYITLYFSRENYDEWKENENSDGVTKNNDQKIILSDFVLEEHVKGTAPEGDAFMGYIGHSLRKETESTKGQAFRNKFTVSAEVINGAYDGYELVEYGAVVALANDSAEPILNATSYTVRKGVAYQKAFGATTPTTDIYWSKDDNGVTFSAALYNIPTNQYGTDIAIRAYARFENAEGDSYVRYGTTQIACVFDVAAAILAGNKEDDKAYVNDTLLKDGIVSDYTAWLEQQSQQ